MPTFKKRKTIYSLKCERIDTPMPKSFKLVTNYIILNTKNTKKYSVLKIKYHGL